MKNKKNILTLVLMFAIALPLVLFTTGCAKSKEKYIQLLEGKGYTVTETSENTIRAVYEKNGEFGDVRLTFYSSHEEAQNGYNQAKAQVATVKQITPSYDYSVYWTGNVVMVGNAKGLNDAK